MRSPNTGNPMRLVEGEAAAYTLRGQQFQVNSPVWECPDTGEQYTTSEQSDVFLDRLHQAWRESHGIGRAALHQRRKVLGLSAAQTSALLGLGINQYRTYENSNKLPSKSNAVLLKLLLDDQAMAALLAASNEVLPALTRRKVRAHMTRVGAPGIATIVSRPTTVGMGSDQAGGSQSTLSTYQAQELVGASDYTYAMAA